MCRMPKNKAVERRPMGAHAATHSEIPRSLHCIFYADIVDIEADQRAALLDISQTAPRHRLRQATRDVEKGGQWRFWGDRHHNNANRAKLNHLRNDAQHWGCEVELTD